MRKAMLAFLALGLLVAAAAHASNPVRISQMYGGGGSYYKCDYIELFNNSNAPVSIGGWSVQYASSSGASFGSATYNLALIPSGATIPACGYYLITGYCSSAGADLPVTPDLARPTPATWTFNFSGTAGKVALFSDQVTGRTCATAQSSGKLMDLVGYGTGTNCYETAVVPACDVSSVLVRGSGGALDTDDNSADFSKIAEPWPMHNSASAANPQCANGPPGPPALVAPADGATDVEVPATLTVTVSDPDADLLTVQFYGRESQPGACCTAGYTCVFVSDTECAALGGTFKGVGVTCESGICDAPTGACCTEGDVCAVVTAAACAAQGGTYRGNGTTCTTGICDIPVECELIMLPDTQEYTTQENGGVIAMFQAQTQWIVDNRVSRGIVAVAHEGDITDKWNATEYDRSLTAMTKLEDPVTTGLTDGIPYAMLMGNHDDDNPTLYNQYYGVSRFSGRGYYGGYYGSDNNNNYMLFSGAGRDFVLVAMSYAPSSAVLTWARGVLNAYPNRVGLVVSHSILNEGGTQTSWTAEGTNIYNALSGTPNLRLMMCGHMSTFSGEGRRTDTSGGYTIHSLLADYQDRGDGGGGRLRIMQFVPGSNIVRVRTYSPYTDVWEADADSSSQFTLSVDLAIGGSPQPQPQAAPASSQATLADFALLHTATGVPSGSYATFEWGGLDPATKYEWYVKVSDGHNPVVTGPTWDFTTWDGATSTLLSLVSATAEDGQVHLEWYATGDGLSQATLYRRSAGSDWAPLAILSVGGTGRLLYEDREVEAGSSYGYRLGIVEDGAERFLGETWVEVPGGFDLALAARNPAREALQCSFTLPRPMHARLEVLDVQGRVVAVLADGDFGAGPRRIQDSSVVPSRGAGLYFVRLVTAEGSLVRRVALLR